MSPTADAREQDAVHNAGRLFVMRGLHAAGAVLFAAVVPRLMGPEGYGQVALLVSLSMWFTIAADLGFTEVLVREAPRCEREREPRALMLLFGRLLAVRTAAGLVTAALYLLATSTWLSDLDGCAVGLLAAAVFVRAPADLCFSLHLGQNRAARWGLEDVLRLWGNLALMLPGFLLGGLRGAALGVLLLEVAIATVGLVSVRAHLAWTTPRWELAGLGPYLRFGLLFYGVHLTTAAFESSGEVLLRAFHGDYAHIAFFRVAYSAYALAASVIIWTTFAFAPLLSALHLEHDREAIRRWLERISQWLGIGCTMTLLAAVLVADDLVPLVFGQAFRPVAQGVTVLTAGLFAVALSSIANLAALGYGRGGVVLGASVVQVAVFWLLGPLLVSNYGWLGAALGVLCALVAQAVFSTVANQARAGYSLGAWLRVVLLGVLFLPLGLVRASALVDASLLGFALVGYVVVLWLLRLVTSEDLSSLVAALGRSVGRSGVAAMATVAQQEGRA